MYLSFRIQYIASQVILPVGFIILNTVVFGSYCVSRDDLFTTIRKLKTFGLIGLLSSLLIVIVLLLRVRDIGLLDTHRV